jgi:protein-disulfide isomerase
MAELKVPVTAEDHRQGEEKAAAVLVEYGDYQCPYCGRAYPIVKAVQKHFGKRLCFVFRNFPLSEMHPNAQGAAETAEFAGANGKFWEMHDALFENQNELGEELYGTLAGKLKLPRQALDAALRDGTYLPRVKADFLGGVRSGVNGTPTFYINGKRHDGSFELEDLVEAINALG